jgi:hypothetical protein
VLLGHLTGWPYPKQIMRRISRAFALALVPAMLACAADLTPRIGTIEIYGARKVPQKKIREALGVQEGGILPPSRSDVEERLDKMHGVVAARLEATCCTQGKMILYVGVQEGDTPHAEFHLAPTGDVTLPPEITKTYQDFLDAAKEAARSGITGEDLTSGYSLMADSDTRPLQILFITQSEKHLSELHDVIRNSGDPEQRATAAYVLQYAPRNERLMRQTLDDLQYALQDGNDTVRSNALRSLKAVAVGAKLHPEQNIVISATWFVELLNSIVWSDRRNASLALVDLTDSRDPEMLALIHDRAFTSVVEMARWQKLEHALPAFILVGRVAGLSEDEIRAAWVNGDRETVIKKALTPAKRPSLPQRILIHKPNA